MLPEGTGLKMTGTSGKGMAEPHPFGSEQSQLPVSHLQDLLRIQKKNSFFKEQSGEVIENKESGPKNKPETNRKTKRAILLKKKTAGKRTEKQTRAPSQNSMRSQIALLNRRQERSPLRGAGGQQFR